MQNPQTIATAIRIGNPASWDQAKIALEESKGSIHAISDDEIINAYKLIASKEGIFVEPASSISIAGLFYLKKQNYDFSNKTVVCVLTGNGLKDPEVASKYLEFKQHNINPTLKDLTRILDL